MWIVEVEYGVYLNGQRGDPGRTLLMDNAKLYKSERGAQIALGKARRYRPFLHADIREVK